ncbi:MAG: MarR family transcriptional regulator [Gammaproteobacteria bacterium]|nr:MarR family transcriptional regulator [Gammaproteobacteria bacterium]
MSYPVWSANIDTVAAAMQCVAQRHGDLPVELLVLTRLIVGLGRDLSANLDELLRAQGLAEGELRVLMLLYGQADGTANPGSLAAHTSHSPANITRIANGLVGRGLITRIPSAADRRCVTLRLTRRGEALVRGLLPRVTERTRRTYTAFSAAEVHELTAQLRRVADALAAGAAPQPPARRSAP